MALSAIFATERIEVPQNSRYPPQRGFDTAYRAATKVHPASGNTDPNIESTPRKPPDYIIFITRHFAVT